MTKKQLLNNKEISYYGLPNDVSGISIDSRKVNKGDIFFFIRKKTIRGNKIYKSSDR